MGGGGEHSGFVLIMFIKSPHKVLLVSLREGAYRKQGTVNRARETGHGKQGKWGKRIRGSAFLFSYYFFHKFGELSSIHLLHQ